MIAKISKMVHLKYTFSDLNFKLISTLSNNLKRDENAVVDRTIPYPATLKFDFYYLSEGMI